MLPRAFDVDIVRPNESVVYELGDDFWQLFQERLIDEGRLTAHVRVYKASRALKLLLDIQGTVALVCDRSLRPFDYPLHIQKEVTFRLGQETKELDEDLYMLDEHSSSINIAQHLYDFICLAIPMKKIHPDLPEDALHSSTF